MKISQDLRPEWEKARRHRAARIRRKLLKRLVGEQNHRCAYCACRFGEEPHSAPTLDHLQPRTFGGTDTYLNCVAACEDCNNRRGTLPPMQFARSMGAA